MARVHIADRDVEGLAKVSYKSAAKFYKRKPVAWRAPYPPRVEPKAATNAETEAADDTTLILRATIAAALRKNGNAP